MTAPVPLTPTEAREAAKRALAEVLDYAAIVRQDAPSMKALDLLDALDRFVAALPAEPRCGDVGAGIAGLPPLVCAHPHGHPGSHGDQTGATWTALPAEPAADARLAAAPNAMKWIEALADREARLAATKEALAVALTVQREQAARLAAVDSIHVYSARLNPPACIECGEDWPCPTSVALSGAAPVSCTPYCDGPCSDPCAALSPAQPDPATVERARAEGREQGLREAEQAVRGVPSYSNAVALVRDECAAVIARLSSATPSDEETRA